MSATVTVDTGTHAWHATAGPGRERVFRAARRHSRWVRSLRVCIPTAVAVGLALYALSAWLNPLTALSRLPSGARLVVSGTKITMDLPKLAGFTRDGRSYELTAAAAAQDLRRPHFIELKEVRAKVELVDRSVVNVTASTGLYETKSEVVTLYQDVVVTSSSGTEIRLSEARLDMRKGHVVSNKPVEVLLPNGRIDAKQMEVIEGGDVVQFRGGVTMLVNPDSVQTSAGESRR
jgi:lipopolysaccharide export system protein LptC